MRRSMLPTALAILLTFALCPSSIAQTTRQFADGWSNSWPQESNAFDILPIDLDVDGDLDVIVIGRSNDTPRVWVNDGRGRFTNETATRMPVHRKLMSDLAAIDVDGDCDPDVVAVGFDGTWLFRNDGTGKFTLDTGGNVPATGRADGVLDIDVDLDGDRDLVVGVYDTTSRRYHPTIWSNDGTGKFVATTWMPPTLTGYRFASSDVDGDLDTDLVVMEYNSTKLLLNSGFGTYREAPTGNLPITGNLGSVTFADVDGDGDDDFCFASDGGQDQFLGNDGTGKFSFMPTSNFPRIFDRSADVVAADFDRDGDIDLAYAVSFTGSSKVYINDGTGKFSNLPPSNFPPNDERSKVLAADFDCDGDADLLYGSGPARELARFYWNAGNNRFRTEDRGVSITGDRIVTGDLDGDRDPDVVTTGRIKLLDNAGFGDFRDVTNSRFPLHLIAAAIALADVDGDRDLDIVASRSFNSAKYLFLNDGTGRFTLAPTNRLPVVSSEVSTFVVTDFNGDGKTDIWGGVSRNGSSSKRDVLWFGDGAGKFTDATAGRWPAIDEATYLAKHGDLDGDGSVDLVTGSGSNDPRGGMRIFLNDGKGTFREITTRLPARAAYRAARFTLGDVDGDDDLDLVATGKIVAFRQAALYLNDGRGNFTDATETQIPRVGAWANDVIDLADIDLDDDLDMILGQQLYLNDGSGKFTDATSTRLPPWRPVNFRHQAVADFDLDGDPDVYWSEARRNTVLFNRHRQLTATPIPKLGKNLEVEFWSEPGYANTTQTHLPFLGFEVLPQPIFVKSVGHVFLNPAKMVGFPVVQIAPPGGSAKLVIPIPVTQVLVGRKLHFQSLALHSPRNEDWHFTNATSSTVEEELVAPKVATSSPKDGALDVDPAADIRVRFSVELDASSVTSSSIEVRSNGDPIDGTVSYDNATRTIRFVPKRRMYLAARHEVTLKPTIRSALGVSLGSEATLRFEVRDGSWKVLAGLPSGARVTDIAADERGVGIVLHYGSANNGILYAQRYLPGSQSQLMPAVQLSSSMARASSAKAAVSPDGHAVIVWYQGDAIMVIHGSPDGKWGNPIELGKKTGQRFGASELFVEPGGGAIVTWYEGDNSNSSIWFSRLDPRSPPWTTPAKIPFLDRSQPSNFRRMFVQISAGTDPRWILGDREPGTNTTPDRIVAVSRTRTTAWKKTYMDAAATGRVTKSLHSVRRLPDGRMLFLWQDGPSDLLAGGLDARGARLSPIAIQGKYVAASAVPLGVGRTRVRALWSSWSTSGRVGQNLFAMQAPWATAWGDPTGFGIANQCTGYTATAMAIDNRGNGHTGWIRFEVCSGQNVLTIDRIVFGKPRRSSDSFLATQIGRLVTSGAGETFAQLTQIPSGQQRLLHFR